ncbi:MAG: enoyl-CoA hydratase/isomerase family protein [Burkholderiales bacterium]|nr:enoyl-CoA hydratase/isomerase family protein [Burkholderiales bacterium]
MAKFETLLYAVAGGVATLTLNRPEALNALSPKMAGELLDALAQAQGNDEVRALVLTGAGGAFCAGGDVRGMDAAGPRTAEQARAGMERYRRLVMALHGLDKPVIAAADGVAFGAGFSLLLLADIVLLSERARLCMAFQRIGLIPDTGALFTLPRIVGLQRAKDLMLSAREVGAQEALSLGLALEVLPVDQLLPRAMEMAVAFCGASASSLAMTKRALNASQQSDLDTMMALESSGQALALSNPYLNEAARRFTAKEPGQFRWPGPRKAT